MPSNGNKSPDQCMKIPISCGK